MQDENMNDEIDTSELPVSGVLRRQRRTGYGAIPDLEDEAPVDSAELQRLVAYAMYGPLIDLPGRGGRLGRVVLDTAGELDWEAIGPAGGRRRPARAREDGPMAERRAELAYVLGLIGLLNARIPGTAKYLVRQYVRMGLLDVTHVVHRDLRALITLEARARRLQAALSAHAACEGRTPTVRPSMPCGRVSPR